MWISPEEIQEFERWLPSEEATKACLEDTIEKAHNRVIQHKIRKIEDQLKDLSIYVTKSLEGKSK